MDTKSRDSGSDASCPTKSHKNNPAAMDQAQLRKEAIINAVKKVDPRDVIHNPVMFVVEIGSIITTILFFISLFDSDLSGSGPAFTGLVTIWLWFTLLFANYSEALAEGHGRAQAEALKRMRSTTTANKVSAEYSIESGVPPQESQLTQCSSADLRKDDVFFVKAGETIPNDGEIVLGVASVDESAITGESAPVIRESGGDRNAVTGGTRVLSDWIVVRSTANPGEGFIDKMIGLIESSKRKKTPNEMALTPFWSH